MAMQRVTLRVPEPQIDAMDRLVEDGEYRNRSEAIRDAIRDMLDEKAARYRTWPYEALH